MRDGWIGTRDKSTKLISEVIQSALDGDRAVVVARTGESGKHDDAEWRDLL